MSHVERRLETNHDLQQFDDYAYLCDVYELDPVCYRYINGDSNADQWNGDNFAQSQPLSNVDISLGDLDSYTDGSNYDNVLAQSV